MTDTDKHPIFDVLDNLRESLAFAAPEQWNLHWERAIEDIKCILEEDND